MAFGENGFKQPKIAIKESIKCQKCGEPSGWTNDALRHANANKELRCKHCGQICIRVICGQKDVSTSEDTIEELKEHMKNDKTSIGNKIVSKRALKR